MIEPFKAIMAKDVNQLAVPSFILNLVAVFIFKTILECPRQTNCINLKHVLWSLDVWMNDCKRQCHEYNGFRVVCKSKVVKPLNLVF